MNDLAQLSVPFFIGLLSAWHCFGMCGGIVGALTMSLDKSLRLRPSSLFGFNIAYNTGRIFSYSIAGLIVGLLGQGLTESTADHFNLGRMLRVLSALLLIVLGLYVAGWLPAAARIENLGQPIWRRLQPLGKRMLPVKSWPQALFFGLIWGWLPCGLVYYALMQAFATGNAQHAAGFMLAFGLGTLLPIMALGQLAGWLTALRRSRIVRDISGGILVLMGLYSLWQAFSAHAHHAQHMH
jgi:sulfite exporter TauE/SafE